MDPPAVTVSPATRHLLHQPALEEVLDAAAREHAEVRFGAELEGITQDARGVRVALADGIGLGHVVLHEPRIIVKNLIAENVDRERFWALVVAALERIGDVRV